MWIAHRLSINALVTCITGKEMNSAWGVSVGSRFSNAGTSLLTLCAILRLMLVQRTRNPKSLFNSLGSFNSPKGKRRQPQLQWPL